VKTKTTDSKSQDKKAVWWIGFFLFSVTIYFNSKVQDPFNAPKFWALLIGSGWLCGFLFTRLKNREKPQNSTQKTSFALTGLFILFMTASMFMSENKQIALFGDNMRKNGYLTYLALAIVFLTTIVFLQKKNFINLYLFMLASAYVVGGYGLLQMTGNDFISWSSTGMALFSTLGNSNFAGSAMAILAIIVLGGAYIYRKVTWIAISSVAAFTILLITIFPTNARQGLLLLFFGIGALAIVFIYNYNRILGRIAVVISAFGFVASILGMLQIGPLEKFLYKDSVSVRGYYWRSGIEMFQSNILFGVGLDNYGSFFKQYREVGYPLKYGYDLTSTNAHNVFIQHFATGGLFVGISYFLLTIFIFWRGLKSMKQFQGDERFFSSVFFVAWLAFQAQSVISIDNIGISIWGWVLGGVVVALSIEETNDNVNKLNDKKVVKSARRELNLVQPTISALFGSFALVLAIFLQRGEVAALQQRTAFNPSAPAQKEAFYQIATKTRDVPLIDFQYKVLTGAYLHSMGYQEEAIKLLEELHLENPNSLDTLNFLSGYYELLGDAEKSLVYRKKLAVLDPWNANNYLQMAFNYKFIGDGVNQKLYLDKVLSFAGNDANVMKAKLELEQ
jgi:O-antigen ligase